MGSAFLTRKGGGSVTITFDNRDEFERSYTALSVARCILAATTVGNYALFGGGYDGSRLSTVDAYSTSLSRSTPTALSVAKSILAATTVGNYALFGGGDDGGRSSTVDAYSTSLSRSTPTALSVARSSLAATTVGSYALFGGGSGGGYSSTVDAYSIDNKVTIYPGAKYKFSGMSSEVTATEYKQIQVNTPINGYIKLKNVTLN